MSEEKKSSTASKAILRRFSIMRCNARRVRGAIVRSHWIVKHGIVPTVALGHAYRALPINPDASHSDVPMIRVYLNVITRGYIESVHRVFGTELFITKRTRKRTGWKIRSLLSRSSAVLIWSVQILYVYFKVWMTALFESMKLQQVKLKLILSMQSCTCSMFCR